MKVYLDDERPTPEGWTPTRWPEEVIDLLKTGKVTELSLDHDLGDDEHGTGYDVVQWIEKAVVTEGFQPPKISVHSANVSARQKMELGIQSIERLASRLSSGLDAWEREVAPEQDVDRTPLAEAFNDKDVEFTTSEEVLAFYNPARIAEYHNSANSPELQREIAFKLFSHLDSTVWQLRNIEAPTSMYIELLSVPSKFPALSLNEQSAPNLNEEYDEISEPIKKALDSITYQATTWDTASEDVVEFLVALNACDLDYQALVLGSNCLNDFVRNAPNASELKNLGAVLAQNTAIKDSPLALIARAAASVPSEGNFPDAITAIAENISSSVDSTTTESLTSQAMLALGELYDVTYEVARRVREADDYPEYAETLLRHGKLKEVSRDAVDNCLDGIHQAQVEIGIKQGKQPVEEAFREPPEFASVADFLEYYNPNRVAGFDPVAMHWEKQQNVGIELFRSMAKNIDAFFALDPSPEEIKQAMEAPTQFSRGQLHEYPSGPYIYPVVARIAEFGFEKYAGNDAALETMKDYAVLPAAEWKGQRTRISRGEFGNTDTNFKDLTEVGSTSSWLSRLKRFIPFWT